MTTSMNETDMLLYKNITLIIAALYRILAGLISRGSLRVQALRLELVLTPASYPQLELQLELPNSLELTNCPKPSVAPGYIIV